MGRRDSQELAHSVLAFTSSLHPFWFRKGWVEKTKADGYQLL